MPRRSRSQRRGSIAVLSAMLLVFIFALAAFAIDVGIMSLARTDLQRSADAAAHAGVLEYATTDGTFSRVWRVRDTSHDWVQTNPVLGQQASVSHNWFNADSHGDIVVGRYEFDRPDAGLQIYGDPDEYNAVRVRIRRHADFNGEVPLFFARVMGKERVSMEAEATAVIMRNIRGFRVASTGENVPVLPVTIKQKHWDDMLASRSFDEWTWDSSDRRIRPGRDGVPEVVLFPQRTESSGNFGTVNIGHSSNSTSLLGKQMRHGLTQSDLDFHGGDLKLSKHGELSLGGDPGLSASLKDDLSSIAGEPRIIPLYEKVRNPGNNAQYTIVKWVGVRVMSVKLTGGQKAVHVQPANVFVKGAIQGGEETSEQIYTPAQIVR